MRKLLVMIAVVLLGAAPVGAAPIAHREVLPNGIVLLVAERPAVPIVVTRLWTAAGAVEDPPDRAGLANLTGTLLTRGTARRTGPEVDAAIEFLGGGLEADEGLLLRPAPSIHTFFMRFPIDAVFLDRDLVVLKVAGDMRPWRMAHCKRARAVFELPAGAALKLPLRSGDRLEVSGAPA